MPRAVAEKRLMVFALGLALFRRAGLDGFIKEHGFLLIGLYILRLKRYLSQYIATLLGVTWPD
jgi:hypothetical protein